MGNDQLEELLEAMPRIAEAVNSFSSPEVQRDAFATLMRAAGDELPNQSQASGDTHNELQPGTERVKSRPKKAPLATAKKGHYPEVKQEGEVARCPCRRSS